MEKKDIEMKFDIHALDVRGVVSIRPGGEGDEVEVLLESSDDDLANTAIMEKYIRSLNSPRKITSYVQEVVDHDIIDEKVAVEKIPVIDLAERA